MLRILSRIFRKPSPASSQAGAAHARSEMTGGVAAELKAYRAALADDPDDGEMHHRLGALYGQSGEYASAVESLRHAVRLLPGSAGAHVDLGNALRLAGDPAAGEAAYRKAIQLAPRLAGAHTNLAALLLAQGRRVDAVAALRPLAGQPDVLVQLITLMLEDGHVTDARQLLEAHAAAQRGPAWFSKLQGIVELGAHEPQRALGFLDEAVADAPTDPDVLLNRGIALQELGRFDDALACYDSIIAATPDHAPARWRRALLGLLRGGLAGNWDDYEMRLVSLDRPRRELAAPRWQGEALGGRAILVHAEQGLGDEIMFASCLPDVIARAGRCIVDCHPKLERLFRRSFPVADVRGRLQTAGGPWPAGEQPLDFQIPAGSLPGVLRRKASDFPRHDGYLIADATRVKAWQQRLSNEGRTLKVGIAWTGGTRDSRSALRSLALEDLLPVLRVPAVTFVSLQYQPPHEEIRQLRARHGICVHHWDDATDDYDETAALVSAVDVVISVCTAIVHLAGALGRQAWVLTPYVPEWRYGHAGAGMLWYPSVRLYRQDAAKEWRAVLERVAGDLALLAAADSAVPQPGVPS